MTHQLPRACQPIVDDLYTLFATSTSEVPGMFVSRSAVATIRLIRLRFELIVALQDVARAEQVISFVYNDVHRESQGHAATYS